MRLWWRSRHASTAAGTPRHCACECHSCAADNHAWGAEAVGDQSQRQLHSHGPSSDASAPSLIGTWRIHGGRGVFPSSSQTPPSPHPPPSPGTTPTASSAPLSASPVIPSTAATAAMREGDSSALRRERIREASADEACRTHIHIIVCSASHPRTAASTVAAPPALATRRRRVRTPSRKRHAFHPCSAAVSNSGSAAPATSPTAITASWSSDVGGEAVAVAGVRVVARSRHQRPLLQSTAERREWVQVPRAATHLAGPRVPSAVPPPRDTT